MVYLSVPGLKALAWTFVAIDVLLTIGRYSVRWMISGLQGIPPGVQRFKADDALHLLGLCSAITYVALQSSGLSIFIRVEEYNMANKGHVDITDETVFFHIRFGAVLIFWVAMYSIKFAFLMLYRSIFWVSVPFRRAWYAIASFTLLCFLANFMACFWVCGYPIAPTNLTQCLKKHGHTQNQIEYVWVALNTASSIMIILLPMFMLTSLQMKLSKKLSLGALFTLGGLDVFFDIFRTVYTTNSVGVQNLWELLEITIAVMLSSLVAFRQVLTLRRQKDLAATSRTRLAPSSSTTAFDSKYSGTSTIRSARKEWYELDDQEPLPEGSAYESQHSHLEEYRTSPTEPALH